MGHWASRRTSTALQIKVDGLVDRTVYQDSKLTDGTQTNNNDRNFNQYGGVGPRHYEVLPGLKPFAEVQGDVRVHDDRADRFGYLRDSKRRLYQGRHDVSNSRVC